MAFLAEQSRPYYCFDDVIVDGREFRVLKGDEVKALQPRIFDLLIFLIENRGRLVEKQEIFERVWEDAFVSDNALTRAIKEIRRAIGDDANQPRYIETVPKRGYRFIAEVTAAEVVPSPETDETASAEPSGLPEPESAGGQAGGVISRLRDHKVGAAFVLLALGAVTAGAYLAFFNTRPPANQPAQRKLWRLTFDAGLQSEPAWSPDGRFIAYGSDRTGNLDIWVQPVSEGKPVQVTTSPAHDWEPDWSPDGDRIAFRSERDGGGLYVVPALGGNERKIAPFGYRPRWSPDGSEILFFSSNSRNAVAPPKVYIVGLDGTPPREMLSEFLAGFVGRWQIDWYPDGRQISIWGERRNREAGFWTVPLEGGAPVKSEISPEVNNQREEAGVDLFDFRWSPSRNALYFEGVSQGVRNLWKVKIDPQTLGWVAGPERLTVGPGMDTDVAILQDGRKLAFVARTGRRSLWSLPFNAATGEVKGEGVRVTPVEMDASGFDLTRDGNHIAFTTEQAGRYELRVKSLDDGVEKLLLTSDKLPLFAPRWSRDGSRVAYDRDYPVSPERSGYAHTSEHSMAIMSASSDEQLLTSRHQLQGWPGDWTADQTMILGSSARQLSDHWGLYLFPIEAAPHAETRMRLVTERPGYNAYNARFSPDERWICFIGINTIDQGDAHIYVVPSSGGEWRRITEENYQGDKPRWSPDGKTIYFTSARSGFLNVWGRRFDPETGSPSGEAFRVTSYESPARMMASGPATEISVAEGRLLILMTEVSGSIWILENVDR